MMKSILGKTGVVMRFCCLLFCVFLLAPDAYAYRETGIGGVADQLMGPVGLFSDFIYTACFVLGGSFLLASIIKYIDHRRSPLFVPISTVIFLIVAGLILIALPFAHILIKHGTAYSLMRQ